MCRAWPELVHITPAQLQVSRGRACHALPHVRFGGDKGEGCTVVPRFAGDSWLEAVPPTAAAALRVAGLLRSARLCDP